MEQKTRVLDLGLSFFKERVSKKTGWVHFCLEDPLSPTQETIPLFENVLYAYTLIRSKSVLHVQEARKVLERVLAFEVEGNMPIYLHEYPHCQDSYHSSHLLAPLFYLLKDHEEALGIELVNKLRAFSDRIVCHLRSLPVALAPMERLHAFLGEEEISPKKPETLAAWAEWCLHRQMRGQPIESLAWDPVFGILLEKVRDRFQQGYEPEVTWLDLFMAEWLGVFPLRVLASSPAHRFACLVHSFTPPSCLPKAPFRVWVAAERKDVFTLYYGDLSSLHSLSLESKGGTWNITQEEDTFFFTHVYEEALPSEEESTELAFYLDANQNQSLWVEGVKATIFSADDLIDLVSSLPMELCFSADPQQGEFVGQITRANRSSQKDKNPFHAYDWKLGWRTLRREPYAKISIRLKLKAPYSPV